MHKRLVIDASVAAKWFLKDEQGTPAADDLLLRLLADDLELYAPEIFYYELGALLARACAATSRLSGRRRLEGVQARRCLTELFRLPIHGVRPSEAESVRALEMSISYSKSYYDMIYLQLAETMGCPWCTADAKILETHPKNFPANSVVLLSSL